MATPPTAPGAPSAVTGRVPTSVPAGGVVLDQVGPGGRLVGVEAYLYPPKPSPGDLSARAALRAADGALGGAPATPSRTVLARVTLPGTLPAPGATAGSGAVVRREAWVVESKLPNPHEERTCPSGSACSLGQVTESVEIVDARTGQQLAGFETN